MGRDGVFSLIQGLDGSDGHGPPGPQGMKVRYTYSVLRSTAAVHRHPSS